MWIEEVRKGWAVNQKKTQQNVESENIFTDAKQRVSAALRTLTLLVIGF